MSRFPPHLDAGKWVKTPMGPGRCIGRPYNHQLAPNDWHVDVMLAATKDKNRKSERFAISVVHPL